MENVNFAQAGKYLLNTSHFKNDKISTFNSEIVNLVWWGLEHKKAIVASAELINSFSSSINNLSNYSRELALMTVSEHFDAKSVSSISEPARNCPPNFIPANGLHLSLSHTKNYFAAAVSNKPIGVDVQSRIEIKPAFVTRMYKHILSAKDQREIIDPIALWSCMESVAKCSGLGSTYLLNNSFASKTKYGWSFDLGSSSKQRFFTSYLIGSDRQHVFTAAVSSV